VKDKAKQVMVQTKKVLTSIRVCSLSVRLYQLSLKDKKRVVDPTMFLIVTPS
jgi:hypothetical protein